jgi:hypothetical protein
VSKIFKISATPEALSRTGIAPLSPRMPWAPLLVVMIGLDRVKFMLVLAQTHTVQAVARGAVAKTRRSERCTLGTSGLAMRQIDFAVGGG